jgi:hypothetical protein
MTETKLKHSYTRYENSDLWNTVRQAVVDLIENQDLELQTREEYVIGYICKALERRQKDIFKKRT